MWQGLSVRVVQVHRRCSVERHSVTMSQSLPSQFWIHASLDDSMRTHHCGTKLRMQICRFKCPHNGFPLVQRDGSPRKSTRSFPTRRSGSFHADWDIVTSSKVQDDMATRKMCMDQLEDDNSRLATPGAGLDARTNGTKHFGNDAKSHETLSWLYFSGPSCARP